MPRRLTRMADRFTRALATLGRIGAIALAAGAIACAPGPAGPGRDGGRPRPPASQEGRALVGDSWPRGAPPAAAVPDLPVPDLTGTVARAPEPGTVVVRVVWPAPAGRRVLRMPDSTRAVRVEVFDERDALASGSVAVRRDTGEPAVLRFRLSAGTYRLEASAYDTVAPASGSAPVAFGTAANIRVRSSRTGLVPIELRPLNEPAITRIVPGNGGPALVVAIEGRNFGVSRGASSSVSFGGVMSRWVRGIDDSRLEAEVPAWAPSGTLSVVVDGIESRSTVPFQVLGLLRLLPLRGDLLAGLSRPLPLESVDTAGVAVASPSVVFSIEPAGVATVSPGLDLVSLGSGSATVRVTVRSGQLGASQSYAVLARPVAVVVSPATASIDALAADGRNDPGFVSEIRLRAVVTYSDGATDSAVAWASGDTTLCTVSDSGLASAMQDAPAGTAQIFASSARLPGVKGSALVRILGEGEGVVVLE